MRRLHTPAGDVILVSWVCPLLSLILTPFVDYLFLQISSTTVNNVGKSHEMPVSFLETPVEEQQAIIDININGTLRVTKVVLKNMLHQYVSY